MPWIHSIFLLVNIRDRFTFSHFIDKAPFSWKMSNFQSATVLFDTKTLNKTSNNAVDALVRVCAAISFFSATQWGDNEENISPLHFSTHMSGIICARWSFTGPLSCTLLAEHAIYPSICHNHVHGAILPFISPLSHVFTNRSHPNLILHVLPYYLRHLQFHSSRIRGDINFCSPSVAT